MSTLPDRCICGYQGKIDRLENQVRKLIAERDLLEEKCDELTDILKSASEYFDREEERRLEKLIQQRGDS
jgi:outer membrane murein-binding lipoprotein Lpp